MQGTHGLIGHGKLVCVCDPVHPSCRLLADESAATEAVAQAFNIMEVPTFIFMRNGREVARHVGSSRGDLIGKILQVSVRVLCRMEASQGHK